MWRVPILALTVMAAWWFGFRPLAETQEGWVRIDADFALCGAGGPRAAGCVIDGDTVVMGFGPAQRRIRLTGYDAPELGANCAAERSAAEAARVRLNQWLGEGPFEWSGADAPPRDQYGRELRAARRTGADGRSEMLADTMIAADLAAGSGWGAIPRDWCG